MVCVEGNAAFVDFDTIMVNATPIAANPFSKLMLFPIFSIVDPSFKTAV
jgi:hypothetical protein